MSHRPLRLLAFAFAICCEISCISASAQLAAPRPGAWVRVRAPSAVEDDLIGTLVSRTADSIVIARSDSDMVRLPMSALQSLDVSRGKNWRDRRLLRCAEMARDRFADHGWAVAGGQF